MAGGYRGKQVTLSEARILFTRSMCFPVHHETDLVQKINMRMLCQDIPYSGERIRPCCHCPSPEIRSNFIRAFQSDESQPPTTEHWQMEKVPLCCYLQLWPQLVLQNSVLNRKVKHLTAEEMLLIVAPNSLCREFLHMAHNAAGHQGTDKTIARLSDFTYWVSIAKDPGYHCTHRVTCQMVKAPVRPPASIQPIVTSRPWEMVGVDILKVPMSSKENQYLLVTQDYFSK